jgi:hypothetical protein
MRLSKSWVIARKDFKTFKRKRGILYTLVIAPLMVSVLLSVVLMVRPIPIGPMQPYSVSWTYF